MYAYILSLKIQVFRALVSSCIVCLVKCLQAWDCTAGPRSHCGALTCFETVPKLQRNIPAFPFPFLLSYLGAYRPTSMHAYASILHKVFAVSTSVFIHAYIHRSMRPYIPIHTHIYLLPTCIPPLHAYIHLQIHRYIHRSIHQSIKLQFTLRWGWKAGMLIQYLGGAAILAVDAWENQYAQDLRQCDLCITECLLHVFSLILLEVRKRCRMILS